MKGRPVRFAPLRPGANPIIIRRAVVGPKDGTGLLNHSGFEILFEFRKATSRGHKGQFRGASGGMADCGMGRTGFFLKTQGLGRGDKDFSCFLQRDLQVLQRNLEDVRL